MEPVSPWVQYFAMYSIVVMISMAASGAAIMLIMERAHSSRDSLGWFDLTTKLVVIMSLVWPYYILWLIYKGLRLLIKHVRL